jgi:hypothetical protein
MAQADPDAWDTAVAAVLEELAPEERERFHASAVAGLPPFLKSDQHLPVAKRLIEVGVRACVRTSYEARVQSEMEKQVRAQVATMKERAASAQEAHNEAR